MPQPSSVAVTVAFLDNEHIRPVIDTGVPGIVVAVLGAIFAALAYDARPVSSRFAGLFTALFAILGAAAAVAGGMLLGPKLGPFLNNLLSQTVIGQPGEAVPFIVGGVLGAMVLTGLVMMLGSPKPAAGPAVAKEDTGAKAREESDAAVAEGLAMESLDDFEAAFESYDQAIKLNGRNAIARGRRGLMRLRKFEDEAAVKDFERCAELDAALKPALEKEIRTVMTRRGKPKKT